MDFEGRPFGPMPKLLAIAEFVNKSARELCAKRENSASFSFRLTENKTQVVLGEKDKYEARSRGAFLEGMKNRDED